MRIICNQVHVLFFVFLGSLTLASLLVSTQGFARSPGDADRSPTDLEPPTSITRKGKNHSSDPRVGDPQVGTPRVGEPNPLGIAKVLAANDWVEMISDIKESLEKELFVETGNGAPCAEYEVTLTSPGFP